mmetsp:Transcript_30701/g.94992  ORF Transcript_30701/g.94992 Transcript_30701/m.94992 type:complete len:297 (+) Transcript_30701:1421-2311(+)
MLHNSYMQANFRLVANSAINKLELGALGSPALVCRQMHLALIDLIFTRASLDQQNHHCILRNDGHHGCNLLRLILRCASRKDASTLLEWLLSELEGDSSRKFVLLFPLLFEQAVVGNAVPVTIIRVIYKHLGVSIPPRSNTLSKRQKSPPATLHSGSLNPPVAQIKLVSQRVCCMPLGFIPRILWQAWLPRCISILLSPTGADVNFVALWIRYMFSIACATFLQRPPLDPNKAVNSWVFLGAVVGCRKFMLEYASLFFKDLVWYLQRSFHLIARDSRKRLHDVCPKARQDYQEACD